MNVDNDYDIQWQSINAHTHKCSKQMGTKMTNNNNNNI